MDAVDILDMTPTVKPVKTPAPRKPKQLPGRAASSATTMLRKRMLEVISRRKKGIANGELATLLKVAPGKCLQAAQLLVKQRVIVAKKPKGTKYVTWHKL